MSFRNRAVIVGLSAALALGGVAPVAYASPESELAEVAERLESMGSELYDLQESLSEKTTALEKTSYKIGEKRDQIAGTKKELAEAKAVLGGRMRSSYKSGPSSILAVFFNSDSLSDVVSRIYYMDKVATRDAEAIEAVRSLNERLSDEKSDLEKTKADQEAAVEELQEQIDDYSAKVAETQRYYESLDAQIQAEIAARQEAEENARIQAALEAAEREKAEQEAAEKEKAEEEAAEEQEQEDPDATDGDETPEPEQSDEAEDEDPDVSDDEKEEGESEKEEDSSDDQDDDTASVPENGGLSTARAAIGCPYVYGAAGPSSFDCSGLVCYCYGWSRGRTTYDMISSLQSDGRWKTSMSQLKVGDLIFTHEGHVGIYVGNGEMIHAPSPGRSVCQAPVYAFIGGGTF